MRLTDRVSAFFLGALALALACAGITVYQLSAAYLARRSNERLTAAVDTMAAAIELHPGGLEWEPNIRDVNLGRDSGEDQVRWVVCDGDGRRLDQSANLDNADLTDQLRWRALSRTVLAPTTDDKPRTRNKLESGRYHERLMLTAAISPLPDRATLNQLARALLATGGAAWLAAAVVGRWLGRRALAPVRRMASAAAAMSAADLDVRLEPAGTGDELDELSVAFNGLLGRLEEAFEKQRRFTGDAAHQLSTPLTVLLGQLEVALRRERPATEYRTAILEAHAQALRLRQIVEMLLFLARPDADAASPATEVVDLKSWLYDYVAQWKSHPRAADIRLDISEGEPVRAAIAPALLSQLVDNLLDNACKYSPAGTPVTVGLESSSGAVQLRVEDTAPGIPAEDLPRVFEPFYRSPEARRIGKPGVGLGLAVARRIARALGGTLAADSEPGRGSRFVLHLPEAPAAFRPSSQPLTSSA